MKYRELIDAWRHDEVWTVKPKVTTYEKRKALLRDLAIQWQYEFSEEPWDFWDSFKCEQFFEKYGKRYGLLREFRENAIC